MTTQEIIDALIRGGKQTIEPNNSLHKELSALSDYELSQVTIEIKEKANLTLEWQILSDIFEVY